MKCNCTPFDNHFDFRHKNRSIVPFKDKGKGRSKYIYKNQSVNHLAKYKIDGGLISDNAPKCDFLLLNCEQKQSYFIELKGSDMICAVEQIDRSIEMLKNKLPGFAFFARIVLTRVNTIDLKDTKLPKLKKKLKSLNGNLKKSSRGVLEETV